MMMLLLLLMKMVMMARHDEKPKKEVLCAKQGLPLLLCQTAANRPLNSPPMTKVDHKHKIRRKIGTLGQTKDFEINIPPMLQHQSETDFGEDDNVGTINGDDCGM